MIIITWANVLSTSPARKGPWHFTCRSVKSAPCFLLSLSLMGIVTLPTMLGHCLGHLRPPEWQEDSGKCTCLVFSFPCSFSSFPDTSLWYPSGSVFEAFRAQRPPWVWLCVEMQQGMTQSGWDWGHVHYEESV